MLKIFDPNSECFAKYDAFCSHIFDYACLRRSLRLSDIDEVQNYGKIVYIKSIFENGWWEDAYSLGPHPTPLDPPLAISQENHQKSLANFILGPINFVLFY